MPREYDRPLMDLIECSSDDGRAIRPDSSADGHEEAVCHGLASFFARGKGIGQQHTRRLQQTPSCTVLMSAAFHWARDQSGQY